MLRRTVLAGAGSAAFLSLAGTRAARADTLDEVKGVYRVWAERKEEDAKP